VVDVPRLDQSSQLGRIVVVANILLNILFAIEALLRTIAHTLVSTDTAYLRSKWGVLDFMIGAAEASTRVPILLPAAPWRRDVCNA
jgi:hypothetical protein